MDIFRTYRLAFRLWMRKRVGPYSLEEAEEKRLFWAKCYAAAGLLAMGACTLGTFIYDIDFNFKEKGSKDLNILSALQRNDGPVRIVKFKGFSVESNEVVTATELEQRIIQKNLSSSDNSAEKEVQ